MAVSTFLGVETALRGLLAQQRSLDVTSHNISNANTAGYSRQQATLATTAPLYQVQGALGTGVDVVAYSRMRDAFLDVQLHAQTMLQGYHEARQDVLQQVELALSEPSDTGLSNLLSTFWSSWQDVANAPENLATRQALLQSGQALATGLQSLSGQLDTIAAQAALNQGLTANDVLGTVNRVLDLEGKLAAGQGSNDLLDERDALLDHLGTLVNVSATTDPADSHLLRLDVGGVVL